MASSATWTDYIPIAVLGLVAWAFLKGWIVPRSVAKQIQNGQSDRTSIQHLRDRLEFEKLRRQIQDHGLLYDEDE